MIVRDADSELDAEVCAAVYAPYVTGSVASFEERPPSGEEMAARIRAAHEWLVAEAARHRAGVGRALYTELFERLRERGFWMLCAGITLPNDASAGLHRAMGFVPVGTYRRIGWKFGAWHDVEWLQLDLRPGDDGAPAEPTKRAPA
jgi:phosphinothricin acetyltransferase